MRIIRIYQPADYLPGAEFSLSESATHHLVTVLRVKEGQLLQLFDGANHICQARIVAISKKKILVEVLSVESRSVESPLPLILAQAISKGDRMEWVVQKSVELGIQSIQPLISEHCALKLDADRLEKKVRQWQAIAISACEQSGRNSLPGILPIQSFEHFIAALPTGHQSLILNPEASVSLRHCPLDIGTTHLLVGPEGGFSQAEMDRAEKANCLSVRLGPRILRTETAAIVAQSLLQGLLGDL